LVGHKGQITIEAPIRESLGIAAGWRAIQRLEDDTVVIRFVPPKHNRSLAGILRNSTSVRIETEDEMHDAIEEAWTQEAVESKSELRVRGIDANS
jgi:bifunctional DNA-binding transcriptional regulator/antitoxin component of YhaV-PrlF toxin-antitoxin module